MSFKPIFKLLDWIDIDKLNWEYLSANPNAIHLLERNFDKIDWQYLSINSGAIDLLKTNFKKINWKYLSENPSIFELDKDSMKLQIKDFYEDLQKVCFHPKRVERYLEKFNYDIHKDTFDTYITDVENF